VKEQQQQQHRLQQLQKLQQQRDRCMEGHAAPPCRGLHRVLVPFSSLRASNSAALKQTACESHSSLQSGGGSA
jgi:hypothetical protein